MTHLKADLTAAPRNTWNIPGFSRFLHNKAELSTKMGICQGESLQNREMQLRM